MTTDAQVEAAARAICKSRGRRADDCVFGSGFVSQDQNGVVTSGSECSRYAWQDHVGDARAALSAALADGAEWQPVKGWADKYQVSSEGRVRKANGDEMGQWTNADGYKLVRLSDPRLTDEQVKLCRRLQRDGVSHSAIAKQIGSNKRTVGRILRGETYAHVR